MTRAVAVVRKECSAPSSEDSSRLGDLVALRAMATYLVAEAARLDLDLSYSVAMLPAAIDQEIALSFGVRRS